MKVDNCLCSALFGRKTRLIMWSSQEVGCATGRLLREPIDI